MDVKLDLISSASMAKQLKSLFILAKNEGMEISKFAEKYNISKNTAYKWNTKLKKNGNDFVKISKRGRKLGNGRYLTPEEEIEIQNLIKTTHPKDNGILFSRWTRRSIVNLILVKFGKKLSISAVGKYLKRWNFTFQRPLKKYRQKDPQEIEKFLNVTYPTILEETIEDEGIIVFLDESRIDIDGSKQGSFSPKGITPIYEMLGGKISMNFIMVLSNDGTLRYKTYEGSMNCRLFISFLTSLLVTIKTKNIKIITDNLRVHHGKMVQAWLDTHERIKLYYLPSYCPYLNPVEYGNHYIKIMVYSEPQVQNKKDFKPLVRKTMKEVQKQKKKLANICTHKKVAYAGAKSMKEYNDNKAEYLETALNK
jgi:transposase